MSTLEELKYEAIESGNFEKLGAVQYMMFIDCRHKSGEELSELEIHRHYDAKKTILEWIANDPHRDSEETDLAKKKLPGARKEYSKTDPLRDLPF